MDLWSLPKSMPRLGVSLVSDAGMFWWTPNVPVSGGTSIKWCVRFEFGFVSSSSYLKEGWSAMWISWKDGIVRSAIHLSYIAQSQYLCRLVAGSEAAPVGSGILWWPWPMVFLLFFWRGQLMFWLFVSVWYLGSFFVWAAFLPDGDWLLSLQLRKLHLPPSEGNYRLLSTTPLYPRCLSLYVCSSWVVYGMLRCAINHPVHL